MLVRQAVAIFQFGESYTPLHFKSGATRTLLTVWTWHCHTTTIKTSLACPFQFGGIWSLDFKHGLQYQFPPVLLLVTSIPWLERMSCSSSLPRQWKLDSMTPRLFSTASKKASGESWRWLCCGGLVLDCFSSSCIPHGSFGLFQLQ